MHYDGASSGVYHRVVEQFISDNKSHKERVGFWLTFPCDGSKLKALISKYYQSLRLVGPPPFVCKTSITRSANILSFPSSASRI